ncbi:MAG: hypothetical protein WD844_07940 [Thermoleophilaceae bacterium]
MDDLAAVSGSVKTTSLILVGLIRCADNKTICARRQVTTEPLPRRTIRNRRLPSSLLISRSSTLAAILASRSPITFGKPLRRRRPRPWLWKPANVAGHTTSSPEHLAT